MKDKKLTIRVTEEQRQILNKEAQDTCTTLAEMLLRPYRKLFKTIRGKK